jgi:hypothetical protein
MKNRFSFIPLIILTILAMAIYVKEDFVFIYLGDSAAPVTPPF